MVSNSKWSSQWLKYKCIHTYSTAHSPYLCLKAHAQGNTWTISVSLVTILAIKMECHLFCRQSMCQLVTFSSHIVQFAAVCDFNQASALVKMCSACWLLMRSANRERGEEERERKRSVEKDGARMRLETKSCSFNSETWISICPLMFLTAISKGKMVKRKTAVITD